MQTDFLKNNQEKIFLFLGFILVFFTGVLSSYFYLQEQDNKNSIVIQDASQDCRDLFNENKYIISNNSNSSTQVKGEQSKSDNPNLQNKTGMFIASKNSKIYHSPDCQYVKRIKEENKIYFKSAEEARDRGYSSHSCVDSKH